jgi:quercetin dioxygenase-like cupin family protein
MTRSIKAATGANGRVPRMPIALAMLAMFALATLGVVLPNVVHADHGLPHGTILARGAFAAPTDVKIKSTLGGTKRIVNVMNSADVIVQNVTIEPGAQTGWHSHPGPAVAVVTAGTLTLYQGDDPDCGGETFTAGQVFVDPGQGNVHNARNEGTVGVSVYVTYFDVPPGSGPAIPHANPGHCAGF